MCTTLTIFNDYEYIIKVQYNTLYMYGSNVQVSRTTRVHCSVSGHCRKATMQNATVQKRHSAEKTKGNKTYCITEVANKTPLP